METLGERLRNARKQKGFTQKQLAEIIGAAHNSISDWENNKCRPDPDTIELILGALNIDANTLLVHNNPEQIKADAEELTSKIITNSKIKKLLPLIEKLSDEDIEILMNIAKRMPKK